MASPNISGGSILLEINAYSESVADVFGRECSIGGVSIAGALPENWPPVITDRNVTPAGIFANRPPFDFELNFTNVWPADYVDVRAALTITLASNVPVPAGGVPSILAVAAVFLQYQRR